jgi:hypothetical protein
MRWLVRYAASKQGEVGATTEEAFDAVVVAVGQYTQPRLPTINGMDKWRRRQLHSHSYRVPDSFRGEVVVVVGCHESGKDIALELRKVARDVHVSVKAVAGSISAGMSKAVAKNHNLHLNPEATQRNCPSSDIKPIPARVCDQSCFDLASRRSIACARTDGRVVFADGSTIVADAVIYCTGYDYSFPFLDTGGLVTVDDSRVGPLYEHTFPPALAPSLSFVGVPKMVAAVPRFYEAQARWVARVLSGRSAPAVVGGDDALRRGVPPRQGDRRRAQAPLSHAIAFDLVYCDEFGEKHCGFPRLPEWKKELVWSAVRSSRDDAEGCAATTTTTATSSGRDCSARAGSLDVRQRTKSTAATQEGKGYQKSFWNL